MSQKPDNLSDQPSVLGRRKFLNTTAIAGLYMGLVACTKEQPADSAAVAQPVAGAQGGVDYSKYEVLPGQLDTYYSFSSGGHSGECRIYGLPSGRLFKRIPVFNIDCLVGWGITNESKKIMGTKADGSLKYCTGDTHHVHPSYTDGTYNGKHMFVNDKIHGRIARIRMDTMECDTASSRTSAIRWTKKSTTRLVSSAAASSTFRSPTMAATLTIRRNISACLPASMRKR